MDSISEKNKRIAKNTIMLYLRMLVVMGVTLYTSRVILQVLGVEDYGIFSIVGGVVVMLGFVGDMMTTASQRFITYELGAGNKERLHTVFSSCVFIHIALAVFIVMLAETIGLWLFYEKLTIPPERLDAAFWMYQSSIAITVITFITVPFDATIIAHERMNVYAIVSIIDAAQRLLIAYALTFATIDKLVLYAILLLAGTSILRLCYMCYGFMHFKETHVKFQINRPLLRSILSFAGWSFIGNITYISYTQGVNILLNIFFNPIVNAARGIAIQVQTAVMKFVASFQSAINPQITKSYAEGNLQYMNLLVFRSSRFSFYVLYMLTLPLLLETPKVLELWLVEVPESTVIFTRLTLLTTLICTLGNPMTISAKATGKIKKYETAVGIAMFSILPISYILLRLGMPATSVFVTHLIMECVAQCIRVIIVHKLIGFSLNKYFSEVVLRIFAVSIVSAIPPCVVFVFAEDTLTSAISVMAFAMISVGISILYIGITTNERAIVTKKIFDVTKRLINYSCK